MSTPLGINRIYSVSWLSNGRDYGNCGIYLSVDRLTASVIRSANITWTLSGIKYNGMGSWLNSTVEGHFSSFDFGVGAHFVMTDFVWHFVIGNLKYTENKTCFRISFIIQIHIHTKCILLENLHSNSYYVS